MLFAGRQAAMLTYGLAMVISANSDLFGRCPSFHQQIDRGALKDSNRRLRERFPSIERVRLAAAHPGELGANPSNRAEHSVDGSLFGLGFEIPDAVRSFVSGMIQVSPGQLIYSATIKGTLVTFELSAGSHNAFREVIECYFAAFPTK